MAKTFLWIEDRKRKASYMFWENFMKQLYPDVIREERREDDICGLDNSRLSVFDKMKRIYMGSSLKPQFSEVGLEVVA